MSKIVIAGGSGFLGQELANYFTALQDEVIILSRGQSRSEHGVQYVQWDARTNGSWIEVLEGADILINLTGKSVDCRYTENNKNEIIRSRVDSSKILGQVVEKLSSPPKLWMNASTATIYRHSEDKMMTEADGEIGSDFSMNVAKAWEEAFYDSNTPKTRKVALRISLVLGKSGGVYPVLRRLAKFGLAGKMGSGNQRFAWIHIDDVKKILSFVISNDSIEGPINCVAPSPPTNAEFLKELRKSIKAPFGIPQPKLLLKIGGAIIGTESELVLKSRWAIPQKLTDTGFKFDYNTHEEALKDLA